MKKVTTVFLLMVFSLSFILCKKTETKPQKYNIKVRNKYFESIDSVKLATYDLYFIDTNECSKSITLFNGKYPFSFISNSGLYFSSTVNVQGFKEDLEIAINNDGEIHIY